MSNSPLVTYTKLSPNHSGKRTKPLDTITIHCVVGHCTVKTIGDIFAPTSRQASSNYGVDDWGGVGLYVDEANRSWCTSSNANDQRAITIEVASDTTAPYAFTDSAYKTLTELVVDICKRNNIKKLVWSTNKNDRVNHLNGCNMTVHRDYANKSCPGDWMYNRMGEFAAEVNKRLGASAPVTPSSVKAGDLVKIKAGSKYYGGKAIPAWVLSDEWYVSSIANDRAVLGKNKSGKNDIQSPVNVSNLTVVKPQPSAPATPIFKAYTVNISISNLNIRSGPGTSYNVVGQTGKGTFTIVDESGGWGKLKSGAGWISLAYTDKKVEVVIANGDLVDFKGGNYYLSSTGGKYYTGKPGQARVTQIVNGAKYPYHVIRTGKETSVYGWVAADLVSK